MHDGGPCGLDKFVRHGQRRRGVAPCVHLVRRRWTKSSWPAAP